MTLREKFTREVMIQKGISTFIESLKSTLRSNWFCLLKNIEGEDKYYIKHIIGDEFDEIRHDVDFTKNEFEKFVYMKLKKKNQV